MCECLACLASIYRESYISASSGGGGTALWSGEMEKILLLACLFLFLSLKRGPVVQLKLTSNSLCSLRLAANSQNSCLGASTPANCWNYRHMIPSLIWEGSLKPGEEK